jgi:hypothetical protein
MWSGFLCHVRTSAHGSRQVLTFRRKSYLHFTSFTTCCIMLTNGNLVRIGW